MLYESGAATATIKRALHVPVAAIAEDAERQREPLALGIELERES
jgi:hypothetical protein